MVVTILKKKTIQRISSSIAIILPIMAQLIFSHAEASSDEKMKTETELHLNLQASEFTRLLAGLNLKNPTSTRIDVYFDIPMQSGFLMHHNVPRAKLRIQKRENEIVLQKSWIVGQSQINSNSITWLSTTRLAATRKSELNSHLNHRMDYTSEVLSAAVLRSHITAQEKDYLSDLWNPIRWPLLKDFDDASGSYPETFLPAASVKKERWQIRIPTLEDNSVTVQLGRDSDFLKESNLKSFEIECELNNPSEKKQKETAKKISEWLQQIGVNPINTSPRSSVDFFQTLEKIYP